jgi:lipopolysaccharide/colanic/teichoic acid biosynthesis glycosyltransferase
MEAAVSHRVGYTLGIAPRPGTTTATRGARSGAETTLRLVTAADVGPTAQVLEDVVPRTRSERVSRITNLVVAAVALVVLAPVMAFVALAVRLTSPGPVLYAQTRVGVDRRNRGMAADSRRVHDHGGKLFTMYKFRTMCVNAEADGKAVWATKRDSRVTPIGRILRAARLDELPQLYNVLRGDMNIVGPRPERPSIFAELRKDIPEYPQRQRVKPGITGWAQINQSYDACVQDVRRKVSLDLEYIRRQSLVEDLKIMSLTVPVMLLRRGGW